VGFFSPPNNPLKNSLQTNFKNVPFSPFFNMIHPGQGVWEYPGATGFGNEAEGSRKSTVHSPTKFPRTANPQTVNGGMFQPADKGNPLLINGSANSLTNSVCFYVILNVRD